MGSFVKRSLNKAIVSVSKGEFCFYHNFIRAVDVVGMINHVVQIFVSFIYVKVIIALFK